MANLNPTPTFDDVYQLEQTDKVQGGAGGIANAQAQALLNRTQYLKGSPALQSPTVVTQALGDSSTKVASTEFVQSALPSMADLYFYGQG